MCQFDDFVSSKVRPCVSHAVFIMYQVFFGVGAWHAMTGQHVAVRCSHWRYYQPGARILVFSLVLECSGILVARGGLDYVQIVLTHSMVSLRVSDILSEALK